MAETQLMTVFSDASFSSGKAGWAAWAKFRGEKFTMSSGITFPVKTISDAETIALCSAILRCIEKFDLLDTIVVAQSDSTDALGALRWAEFISGNTRLIRVAKSSDVHPSLPKKVEGVRRAFAERAFAEIRERNLTIYLKHVRAHTGKDDARSWVNEWCDKEAKKQMRSVVHQSAL
jgi:ribonuclease HI